MHYYTMEILDDERENRLTLYENSQSKIYIEVGINDGEDAPYYTGAIALNANDVRALIAELQRLVKGIEGHERASVPNAASACKDDDYNPRQDGQGQRRASEGTAKQLMLTPEQPIQKINWNK